MTPSKVTPIPPQLASVILTTAVLITAAISLALTQPAIIAAAHQQSSQLTAQPPKASRGEAEVNYRLAVWLNPGNQAAQLGLARFQLDHGQADDALTTLRLAGEGSEAGQLKVRTLIELGRYNQAANESAHLLDPGRPDADLLLAGLAYTLADRTSDLATLVPRLTSPQAVRSLQRIQAGKLTLAAELYATGLLESSSSLLVKESISYSRNLLLARIRYTRHTPTDLNQAAQYLQTASQLNPAALEAHQLLAAIYRDQKKLAAASQQDLLITRLQAGRP